MNPSADAAHLLVARNHQGILSTLSDALEGHPFGSVVAFAHDDRGMPTILISSIAEHTRNIKADPRVSLTLTEPGDDGQALGRVTLVGRALPAEASDEITSRYYARFPQAAGYHQAHDFSFYRIEVSRVRYIGGFGRIHWLEPEAVCRRNPFSAGDEQRMVAHMNADHVDAMRDYCRVAGVEIGNRQPRMSAIDADGFDLMLDRSLLRIPFEAAVSSADEVRKAMVAMLRKARAPA
jgi:putative heme iron utilization protein